MKIGIGIVGVGYVGLVTAVSLASKGKKVYCYDIDKVKIEWLKKGVSPIYEIGLNAELAQCLQDGNLIFTTDLNEFVNNTLIIFLCLPTPTKEGTYEADLSYLYSAVDSILSDNKCYDKKITFVIKSTVPVGTNRKLKEYIDAKKCGQYSVISNPEFLREGTALSDALNPDRIVLGSTTQGGILIVDKIVYDTFKCEKIYTNPETAELIKYASNSFLANKISFINLLSRLCDKVGADIKVVSKGMGSDHRISEKFLNAGLGFGGSCFPKDVKALSNTLEEHNIESKLIKEIININENQTSYFFEKIAEYLGTRIVGAKILICGIAFKKDTDDIRESKGLELINVLKYFTNNIKVYDEYVKQDHNDDITIEGYSLYRDIYKAAKDCDLVILTNDIDYRLVDYCKLGAVLKNKVIFDGMNVLYEDRELLKRLDYKYIGIGVNNEK